MWNEFLAIRFSPFPFLYSRLDPCLYGPPLLNIEYKDWSPTTWLLSSQRRVIVKTNNRSAVPTRALFSPVQDQTRRWVIRQHGVVRHGVLDI